MFRAQATAEYVNANTRGALLAVAPVPTRWLLGAASVVLIGALTLAGVGRVRDSVDGRGEIRPSEKAVAVFAPEGARIRAARKAVGDTVKRGDVIFELDTTEAVQSLTECQRRVERLRKGREIAQAHLTAQTQHAGEGAVTFLLEQRLDAADDALADESARCDRAAEATKQDVVRSPMDGTIADVQAPLGVPLKKRELIASVLPSTATARAYVRVPESQTGRITPGAPVYLRLDAYPYERYGIVEAKVLSVLEDDQHEAARAGREEEHLKVVEAAIDRAPPNVDVKKGLRFGASVVTGDKSVLALLLGR